MKKEIKKTKSNSSIGYAGNVTISVVGSKGKLNKQYKVKNNGYLPLFEYIAYALLGNTNMSSLCPNYIATYNCSTETDFWQASTHATCARPIVKVANTSPTLDSANNVANVELTFIIPGNVMITGSETNCLALYCSDYYTTFDSPSTRNPSAIVMLDENLEIGSDENVVVVWKLTVGNVEESE